jgi:tetratricopeptide (TPR) repeat protein
MSMALSYYGINESQQTLGQLLRPYQNSIGDNDDKSVTLQELVEIAPKYNLTAYRRPAGNAQIIKQFIAADIPVIARTWLKPDDDIGHFRVIKGYDQTGFFQDDSLQGKNLHYTYDVFDSIWKKYNYEYLVLIPSDKLQIAQAILGPDLNEKLSWQKAVDLSLQELNTNSTDTYARFNLSVAYYHIGEYQKSVDEFEKIQNLISFRTLWYQIEPIYSYMELRSYDKVMEITDKILNNNNRAFSELYIMRGDIYASRGDTQSAKQQYDLALLYNKSMPLAQQKAAQ